MSINNRGKKSDGTPNPIDAHVGNRMKLRRQMLKISQQDLAKSIGLTFQQIQKYERGLNRISASRLWDLSQILNVPVGFFFEDINKDTASQSPRMLLSDISDENYCQYPPKDPLYSVDNLELLRAIEKIDQPEMIDYLRKVIMLMAK